MSSNPMYMEYVDDADEPARRQGWRILGWVSIALSAVMVAGSLGAYGFYRKLQGNITTEDVNAQLGPNRPKKLNSAMNILILGSDTRAGSNARYGRGLKNEPPRADTTVLMHLSPGGSQAIGISFPRDLMVQIPACRTKNGGSTQPQLGMINSAFTLGGPACTMKTIEQMSNIKIDHFVQVDFSGFKNVVNAIGGVEICLPKDVNDPQAHLVMKKGQHLVKGEQALAYVRARKGLGDGSDLSRIKRQQQFMGSVASKALSGGVLANPGKLVALLNAATKTLTTDEELTTGTMLKIGQGMQGLSAGKLRFVTVPYGAYAPDPNRVALRQPAAGQLFASVRNDKTIQEEPKQAKIPAAQVQVRVYNASGIQGQAQRVSDQLKAQGFQVIKVGNLPGGVSRPQTQVLYGPGADQHSTTLAGQLKSKVAPAAGGAQGAPGVVDLVIGTDWSGLKPAQSGIPRQQGEIRADGNICKAT
ncbi:LytR family transcriptional regulator [Actinomadura craniellae]|uniref:LytR family transcriptional regulator n=1 Tax=Actinomadura craniellae TaxID=2231787 RepID=A0A365H5A2_9ACTN|nr:LCP family protein [Actinomadura craniellae]RAY14229.1 LytR family transcriptional regulator [Actinomadura craniellae]